MKKSKVISIIALITSIFILINIIPANVYSQDNNKTDKLFKMDFKELLKVKVEVEVASLFKEDELVK